MTGEGHHFIFRKAEGKQDETSEMESSLKFVLLHTQTRVHVCAHL